VFAPIAARFRQETGWRYRAIDSGHTPNAGESDRLADLIADARQLSFR
jgi:hypothetical protein